ncbi:hypothetical protein ENUP19_0198G0023 [Entamoeba nuttalli]|uniref:protein-serine/threonine phosphatase n=1 Tax=Entamoeba nuttalli TaxID=412467 RepID=A0ABQ0DNI2_9EUKA
MSKQLYMKRYSVSINIVLRWFAKLEMTIPKDLPKDGSIELIEMPMNNGKSFIANPHFICEMIHHKVTRIYLHPTPLSDLIPKYLEQHSPTYIFNKSYYEMKKGMIYERNVDEAKSPNPSIKSDNDEFYQLVAHRIMRILKKDFIRRKQTGPHGETHEWKNGQIPLTLFLELIEGLNNVLNQKPSFVTVTPPCFVVGDLSGSYDDAIRLFYALEIIPSSSFGPCNVVLVGDYIPFGPHPIEVFALIAALRILCPLNFVLLNPQYPLLNLPNELIPIFGSIKSKIIDQYGNDKLYYAIVESISHFAIGALIDNKILCLHLGLPDYISTSSNILEELKKLKKIPYKTIPIGGSEKESKENGWLLDTDVLENTKCDYIIRGKGNEKDNILLSESGHMLFLKSHCMDSESKRSAGVLVDKSMLRILVVSKHTTGIEKEEEQEMDQE